MKIGFDLDGIFVDFPPLVPSKLINWLYRNHCSPNLSYRIPKSRFEQFIRKLTHYYRFRPPLRGNIDFLLNFNSKQQHTLYLISSRYGFLEKLTHKILKRYKIRPSFSSINLNLKNEQPHLFKEEVIKKFAVDLFVDDDLELLKHLKKHCPKTKLLWYNPRSNVQEADGVTTIKDLAELTKFLK